MFRRRVEAGSGRCRKEKRKEPIPQDPAGTPSPERKRQHQPDRELQIQQQEEQEEQSLQEDREQQPGGEQEQHQQPRPVRDRKAENTARNWLRSLKRRKDGTIRSKVEVAAELDQAKSQLLQSLESGIPTERAELSRNKRVTQATTIEKQIGVFPIEVCGFGH